MKTLCEKNVGKKFLLGVLCSFIFELIYKCVSLQHQNHKYAMKTHELEKKLKSAGCYILAHGKRHDHWFSPVSGLKFMVPRHGAAEVPSGTLKSIANQSGVNL